jgi:hypothetical protein
VAGETAIPFGTYRIELTHSPRFKRKLPLVCEVPDFEGVRIHSGNTAEDTLGCILVGRNWTEGTERIGASRIAFEALFPKISVAIDRGEAVILRVIQGDAPPELSKRAVGRRRTLVAKRPVAPRKSKFKRVR